MNIYLCGPCDTDNRTLMHKIAAYIREHIPTESTLYCPFEYKVPNAWEMKQERWAETVFNADIKAIDEADYIIMISHGRQSTAGTNWEQGYAFAKKKPIFVLQVNENPASIMTYCGANRFFVCYDKNDIYATIDFILTEGLTDYVTTHYYCPVTLT